MVEQGSGATVDDCSRVGSGRTLRVRVIATTNRDPAAMTRRGSFREDLYYRLCVAPLRLPALRERPSDIAKLAGYFLEEFCSRNNFRQKHFLPETLCALARHSWPGNARGSLREAREEAEREQIRRALAATGGNVSASARILGLERTNLHKRIRALGLAQDKRELSATN